MAATASEADTTQGERQVAAKAAAIGTQAHQLFGGGQAPSGAGAGGERSSEVHQHYAALYEKFKVGPHSLYTNPQIPTGLFFSQ